MEKEEKIITKRKKGIITKNQILETAAHLFACKGYDNVSIREIVKEVGVKESSLYNHFKSKQDILDVLLNEFALRAQSTRPTYEQLKKMITIMSLKEILKNIMFSVGRNTDAILENTFIIIQSEKFRKPRAAEVYFSYLVIEPAAYYQNLIDMMIDRNMIKDKNTQEIIKQYCYTATAVSQEFFMAKHGFGSIKEAVRRMLDTIEFFCDLIETKNI
jgi:AcrR family transcriptional regulator